MFELRARGRLFLVLVAAGLALALVGRAASGPEGETASESRLRLEAPLPPVAPAPGPLMGESLAPAAPPRFDRSLDGHPTRATSATEVLRAAPRTATLAVRVLYAGEPVAGARVALARRGERGLALLQESACDGDGRCMFTGVPEDALELFATGPGLGPAQLRVAVPLPRGEWAEVTLKSERTLRVSVVDGKSRPIGGAEVFVGSAKSLPVPDGPGLLPTLPALVTNGRGEVLVAGLPQAEPLFVNARAAGFADGSWEDDHPDGLGASTSSARIVLRLPRTTHFPVLAGDGGTPDEGTAFAVAFDSEDLRRTATAVTAAMEHGVVIVRGLPRGDVRGVLRTPDGLEARFQAPAQGETGAPVTFQRPGFVTVRLTHAAGAPAVGIALALQAFGRPRERQVSVTDDSGRARFAERGDDAALLLRERRDPGGQSRVLAQIDLRQRGGVHDVALPLETMLLVRVRVGEDPHLPPNYELLLDGETLPSDDVDEDFHAGTVTAHVPLPEVGRASRVRLLAPGFAPSERTLLLSAAQASEVDFVLTPAGLLVVHVLPAPQGAFSLELQTQAADDSDWQRVAGYRTGIVGHGVMPDSRVAGDHAFEGLGAGTYRVFDTRSQVASAAVRITPSAGLGPTRVLLDLTGVRRVEGRVEFPPGSRVAHARVLVDCAGGGGASRQEARVRADGTFRVSLPPDCTPSLTPVHPVLRAARGSVRVRAEPGSPLALRLERGPEARFRLEGHVPASPDEGVDWSGPVEVRLHASTRDESLVMTVHPLADGESFVFGGYEPGTYTLKLARADFVGALTLRGVVLPEGTVDLGLLALASERGK